MSILLVRNLTSNLFSGALRYKHPESNATYGHALPFGMLRQQHAIPQKTFDVLTISDEDSMDEIERHSFFSYVRRMFLQQVLVHFPRGSKGKGQPHITYKLLHEDGQDPRDIRLISKYAYGGRGGEFSELLLLPQTGQLLTFDDRTGIIFELMTNHPETQPTAAVAHDSSEVHGRQDTGGGRRDVQAVFTSWETWHRRQLSDDLFSPIKLVPRWILADGDGDLSSGFKSEWSSIQDGKIIIGSHGYEVWPNGGPYEIGSGHTNVQWVKQVDLLTGAISHVNWTQHFNAISAAVGVKPPGYLTHEAAEWSSVHNRWFFLPRRISLDQPWDPILDGQRGCTLLISCSITFHDVKIVQLKMRGQPERGFSAMRFVPGTQDRHIVATRTVEIEGADKGSRCSSYITVIDLEGNVLMPETFLGNHKYEGLEIMGSTSASVPNLSDALN